MPRFITKTLYSLTKKRRRHSFFRSTCKPGSVLPKNGNRDHLSPANVAARV